MLLREDFRPVSGQCFVYFRTVCDVFLTTLLCSYPQYSDPWSGAWDEFFELRFECNPVWRVLVGLGSFFRGLLAPQ